MLKRRLFGLVISVLFLCTTFVGTPFSTHADSTKLAKIISKDPSIASICFSKGIEIFETYETFFLAEIKEQEEETLKSLGLNYEIIQDAGKIKFGGFEFISDSNKDFVYPAGLFLNPSNSVKQLYFLQFIGPIKQEWRDTLIQNEIKIGFPVDQFGLIIQTNQASIEFLKSFRFVKACGIVPDACKMSDMFDATQERIDLDIITMLHFNQKDLQDLNLDSKTILTYDESGLYGSLIVKNLPLPILPKLAQNQDILLINTLEQPLTYNAEASQVLNINDSTDQNQISGLRGEGEIVGVADTGLSSGNLTTLHPAFTGKIVANFPASGDYPNNGWYDANGHGTHVCGSVLGTGAGDTAPFSPRYKGMAPDAKLVIQYNGYTGSIYTILNDAYNSGARIHTNSWSNQNNSWGQYDSDAMSIDQLMWEHMDMQVLFAAGNSRSRSQYGVWPPPYNGTRSLTNFCGAKNGITVGASQNNNPGYFFNRMSSFSSLGPTHDGRIKPDLIAPGNQIRSTYTQYYWNPFPSALGFTNSYTSMSGTSMATPVTAGALALVRENFRKIYRLPPTEIPASLIKASMINGCNTTNVYDYQTYSGGPQLFLSRSNFTSGYGRVDIKNSLFPTDKNWMFYNEYASDGSKGLKQGELSKKYYVHVTKTNQPLKATLVWTDMPGTPCTYSYDSTVDPLTGRRRGWVPSDFIGSNPDPTPELVNDLDITIRKYSDITENYAGNYFNSAGFSTNLYNTGIINAYDALNNVEVVNIQNPTLGVYEIEVSALRSSIQSDAAHGFRQPYSLVVSGAAIDTANIPNKPLLISGKTNCNSNDITWTEGQPIKDPISNYKLSRLTISGPSAGATETYLFPATVHAYSDKNITAGTEYFYYIQAIDSTGLVSDTSTGIQLGYIVPPGTTGFYTPQIRPTNVVLYWSTPKPGTCPIQGYYLYRSAVEGFPGIMISGLIPKDQPAFADNSVQQGDIWYYSVVAIDTHGFVGLPSRQLKVTIPMDQTETVLNIEASKKELCQGNDVTFKIVITNKSAVETNSLKLTFYPSTDIAFKGTDRLTGVANPSGAIEFLIGKLPAKGIYTFSLFCQQNGVIQWERSTRLSFILSDTKEVLNEEEITLLLRKCGGGNNQGSLGIVAKVLNLVTDPATGERYLPFGEELKLSLDLSGGTGPYVLSVIWGDGKNESKKYQNLEPLTLTHKFESKGTMNLQIELTDSAGNTKKITFTVTIK
jgi:hypothetical protein